MVASSRTALILFLVAFTALELLPRSAAQDDIPVPLNQAVNAFNLRSRELPGGKDQPALTEEAVVAAIRWTMLDRAKLPVSDETFHMLDQITKKHTLPKGFDLELLTGYEPNDQVTFDVWSVRLRIPGGTFPGGSTGITIQEKMIASRIIGDEERKVIHTWAQRERERGGIGSMERAEWNWKQRQERAAAAAIDRGEGK